MNGLLIGRFQPFHLGHLEALRFALSKVEKLWIGVGSSNRPPQKNNPFYATERKEMILSSIDDSMKKRVSIYFIPDMDDHIRWVEGLDSTVPEFDIVFSNDVMTRHLYSKRDVLVESIPFLNRDELSGTNIRGLIADSKKWEHLVPEGTKNFLIKNDAIKRLQDL